jgi:photosystem II stability/assembly factor-like uncharacterized protein
MMKEIRSFKTLTLLIGAALAGVLVAGCDKTPETSASSAAVQTAAPAPAVASGEKQKVELVHIHGLSYTDDGSKIMIPSHFGLAVFDGTNWSKAPGPEHDYMGFSATKDAIYSSGHPAQGSGLINPFGLIKSTDGGQTWRKLGMEGESDFHVLATSYNNNAVYVFSYNQNSKMKTPGMYFTLNDGFSWQQAAAKGLDNYPRALAVHPTEPKTVAAGTEKALYLSQNSGDRFQKIADGEMAGLFFDLDGKHLWFAKAEGQPALARYNLDTKQIEEIPTPPMEKDAVSYIAQNSAKPDEYAIATFQRDVYVSPDGGKTWKQIAKKGEGLNLTS